MSDSKTVYLDLDAIVPEKDVVVKLDGQDHKLEPVTVEQFISNIQVMEKLGSGNLNVEDEKNLIVDMLLQVFPTIKRERLNSLKLMQLNAMIDFAREHGGENKVKNEATEEAREAGNPQ
jgi:hypothetical protein